MKKFIIMLTIVIATIMTIHEPVEAAQYVTSSSALSYTVTKKGAKYATTFKVKGTSQKVTISTKWRPKGVIHRGATKHDNIRASHEKQYYVANSYFKVTNKKKLSGKNSLTGKVMSVKGKLSGVKKGDTVMVYQIYLPGRTKPSYTFYVKQ